MNSNIDYLDSPIGLLEITASDKGVTSISKVEQIVETINPSKITDDTLVQLQQYFRGELKEFDLLVDIENGSEFYQKVWKVLLGIPYGRTTSYLEIARKLGDEKAVRAVGMANGKNPIAIVIPCHRVIGSNGSLTGYAYGIEAKRKLLALENPSEYAINGTLF